MLNASDLKEFLAAAKAELPAIKRTIPVVSDDDVAEHTRDIKSSANEVVLVGVLPSFSLDFTNHDNHSHDSPLILFVVKKHDRKSGYDAFLDVYDQTGAVVADMEKWLLEKSQEFPCPGIFKKINFETFTADPVRDYHGLYGYIVNFEVKN